MKTFGALRAAIRRWLAAIVGPCPCGSGHDEERLYRERDALIDEWRSYLPLAEVLNLTGSDLVNVRRKIVQVEGATWIGLPTKGNVLVPDDLCHRTIALSFGFHVEGLGIVFPRPSGKALDTVWYERYRRSL